MSVALPSHALEAEESLRPALGSLAISIAVHIVLAVTGLLSFAAVPVPQPALAASHGEISVVVQRPPVNPTKATEAVYRNVPRRDATLLEPERVAVDDPGRATTKREEPRIERVEVSDEVILESIARVDRSDLPDEFASDSEGVKSPRLVPGVGRPKYPQACRSGRHRRGGCEGRGEYSVHISEEGKVLDVEIVKSAGCIMLDRAAELFFLQRARFVPVEDRGVPAQWRGKMGVVFDLKREGEDAEERLHGR